MIARNKLFAIFRIENDITMPVIESKIDIFCHTRTDIITYNQAIDNDINVVSFIFIEFFDFFNKKELPIDTDTCKSCFFNVFDNIFMPAFFMFYHRCKNLKFAAFWISKHHIRHLSRRKSDNWHMMFWTIRNTNSAI